jgi:glycerol-1-phosphate dehydrogenase [NAD(P)+]
MVTNDIRDSVMEIKNRQDYAIEKLMKALILIGITLSYVGSTRPGSGSEHHLSHFFEVVGLVKHEPHFVHGTDVAYATVLTAGMRERICAVDTPKFYMEEADKREREWKRIFGPISDEVKRLQKSANSYDNHMDEVYRERWQQMKAILNECPSEKECRHMIEEIGFDMHAFEEMYGTEKIQDAMFYGKDLKDRYSVLWIFYSLFVAVKNKT